MAAQQPMCSTYAQATSAGVHQDPAKQYDREFATVLRPVPHHTLDEVAWGKQGASIAFQTP